MPTLTSGGAALTWDLLTDLQALFQFPFMRNAFVAGTAIALVAGAVGYFMVLRGQSFAGHALANVGFTGAAGALLVGVAPVIGLLAVGVAAALAMGALRDEATSDDGQLAVGATLTFCLALGLLFLRLGSGFLSNASSLLFGSVLGVSGDDVRVILVTAFAALGALAVIGRPLLFASLDPAVAAARGLPVRGLATGFLVLLAVAVAQAVQVVGVLLIFALLVIPAATAQRLTPRPWRGLALSVALALLCTWLGLAAAYFTALPVSFLLTSGAALAYAAAWARAAFGATSKRPALAGESA